MDQWALPSQATTSPRVPHPTPPPTPAPLILGSRVAGLGAVDTDRAGHTRSSHTSCFYHTVVKFCKSFRTGPRCHPLSVVVLPHTAPAE